MLNKINSHLVNVGKSLAETKLNLKISSKHPTLSSPNLPSTLYCLYSFVLLHNVDEILKTIIYTMCNMIHIPKPFRYPLAPSLTLIFQLCLSKGVFSKMLKKAVIRLVYKTGDKCCINYYSPISVLSGVSKIFKKSLMSG